MKSVTDSSPARSLRARTTSQGTPNRSATPQTAEPSISMASADHCAASSSRTRAEARKASPVRIVPERRRQAGRRQPRADALGQVGRQQIARVRPHAGQRQRARLVDEPAGVGESAVVDVDDPVGDDEVADAQRRPRARRPPRRARGRGSRAAPPAGSRSWRPAPCRRRPRPPRRHGRRAGPRAPPGRRRAARAGRPGLPPAAPAPRSMAQRMPMGASGSVRSGMRPTSCTGWRLTRGTVRGGPSFSPPSRAARRRPPGPHRGA